jgi:hypothetical protein
MPVIAAIIVAIIVIYLYFLFVQWLFVTVCPILLVTGSIIGTAVVPIVYGLQLFRTFDRITWWRPL